MFGVAIFLVYSPICWVRTLEFYKRCFIFAVLMIFLAVVTTSMFANKVIEKQGGEPGPDFVSINKDSYWIMIGFAFYMYEGIGCLMPILAETERPALLPIITIFALAFLCVLYVAFACLCYYAWGSDLTEPVVTQMLPQGNVLVQAVSFLFCLNLVFSYPMTMKPTFQILAAVLFD